VLHLQEIVRGPLDMLADLMTMRGSIKKRSQDEHVKRALEQARPLLCSFLHGRQSTLQFRGMVDVRPSVVKSVI
jgi:uncharacterized heparinase superfamily protein